VAIYGIAIGPNSTFGEYCSIRDQNHKFDSVETPVSKQGYFGSPIKIGRDVRIGRGVYIGPDGNWRLRRRGPIASSPRTFRARDCRWVSRKGRWHAWRLKRRKTEHRRDYGRT